MGRSGFQPRRVLGSFCSQLEATPTIKIIVLVGHSEQRASGEATALYVTLVTINLNGLLFGLLAGEIIYILPILFQACSDCRDN